MRKVDIIIIIIIFFKICTSICKFLFYGFPLVAIRSLRDIGLAIVVKSIAGLKNTVGYDMFGLLE